MFITQRYTLYHAIPTIFIRLYWAHFLEKWGDQSKRQLCKEKS